MPIASAAVPVWGAVLPLVVAAVLIASGVAKLVRPDDLAGWAELGVPAVLRRRWLLVLHPWGEIALALALLVFGGILGTLAALVCLALTAAYLVLVARAMRRADDAACACFGSRARITRVTVVRNAWLTVLSIAMAAVIGANPLLGGAIPGLLADASWTLALAVAAITTALVLWPDRQPADAGAAPAAGQTDADDEYIRTRTPAVPVKLASGKTVNLRMLAARRPILLLAVSETCESCRPVIERVAEWRALLPEVDVRLLVQADPEESSLTETAEPQSLHDRGGYVRGSIADWPTPSAVLLGVDGMLAGGPVSGYGAIGQFMGDVYESLHGERPKEDVAPG